MMITFELETGLPTHLPQPAARLIGCTWSSQRTEKPPRFLNSKGFTPSGRIQLTTNQALRISTANHQPVRILSQESPRATLKVARDPSAPGKKALIYWLFDTGFIQDLPWDPGEWQWQPNPPLGDAPFFGYSAKRGYTSIRKSTHKSSMATFLKDLNLRNTSTAQLTARI